MNLSGGVTAVIKSDVFEDNNGALTTANAVNMARRSRQNGVKYHLFKHHCGKGSGITIVKVNTLLQKSEIFAKRMAP